MRECPPESPSNVWDVDSSSNGGRDVDETNTIDHYQVPRKNANQSSSLPKHGRGVHEESRGLGNAGF
jgi:hypothetical protein